MHVKLSVDLPINVLIMKNDWQKTEFEHFKFAKKNCKSFTEDFQVDKWAQAG